MEIGAYTLLAAVIAITANFLWPYRAPEQIQAPAPKKPAV